jgi:hypothetical protein
MSGRAASWMLRSLPALLLVASWTTSQSAAPAAPTLDATLARLARVAELYRDTALGFACEETITYSGTETETGRIRFAYLFVRDASGKLRDYRTWKFGAHGAEANPGDYVPRFLESAYLWAFVFRSDRQPLYRFTLLDPGPAGDRSALVIEFIPRAPIRKGLNDWAGYATIDRKTSQILEVEAYTPEDWNRKFQRDAGIPMDPSRYSKDDPQTYDIERIVTTFGFEKNGMRFPSRVELTLTRTTDLRDSILRTVTQDYAKFEFFSVRSRQEIARFVEGVAGLPARP